MNHISDYSHPASHQCVFLLQSVGKYPCWEHGIFIYLFCRNTSSGHEEKLVRQHIAGPISSSYNKSMCCTHENSFSALLRLKQPTKRAPAVSPRQGIISEPCENTFWAHAV